MLPADVSKSYAIVLVLDANLAEMFDCRNSDGLLLLMIEAMADAVGN